VNEIKGLLTMKIGFGMKKPSAQTYLAGGEDGWRANSMRVKLA